MGSIEDCGITNPKIQNLILNTDGSLIAIQVVGTKDNGKPFSAIFIKEVEINNYYYQVFGEPHSEIYTMKFEETSLHFTCSRFSENCAITEQMKYFNFYQKAFYIFEYSLIKQCITKESQIK